MSTNGTRAAWAGMAANAATWRLAWMTFHKLRSGKSLTANRWRVSVWTARYTVPRLPLPTGSTRRYGPSNSDAALPAIAVSTWNADTRPPWTRKSARAGASPPVPVRRKSSRIASHAAGATIFATESSCRSQRASEVVAVSGGAVMREDLRWRSPGVRAARPGDMGEKVGFPVPPGRSRANEA